MKTNLKIIIENRDFSRITINYWLFESIFGVVCVASTEVGICFIEFCEINSLVEPKLKKIFPESIIIQNKNDFNKDVIHVFNGKVPKNEIKIHVKASKFQIDVWKILLKIPYGTLTTYYEIANKLNKPKAFRAVGNAVGKNPIAFLIPCHRVIKKSGEFGNYKWGIKRKIELINWEKQKKLHSNIL